MGVGTGRRGGLAALGGLAFGLAVLGCQTSPEAAPAPPPALAAALGAVDFGPSAPALVDGVEDPRKLWTYDAQPFWDAGLPDVDATLTGLLKGVFAARAEAGLERRGEVWTHGHVLVVRAEPKALEVAKAFMSQLEAEKLRPIALDLHLVTVTDGRLAAIEARHSMQLDDAFLAQLDRDLDSGAAQTLVRRRMRVTPGVRKSARETRSRRPVVRIALERGLPAPQQETVEDGIAVHATCWLASGGYAVAHLEFAAQQEAPSESEQTLAASFHLPVDGSKGKPGEAIRAAIDLPRIRLAGLRAQARLTRGQWHVVGSGPSLEGGRRTLALARAEWAQRPSEPISHVKTLSLRSLRVALPHRGSLAAEEAATRTSPFFGSNMLGGRTKTVLSSLKGEWSRQQSVSVTNDVGFGRQIATAGYSQRGRAGQGFLWQAHAPVEPTGWTALLPPSIEAERQRFASQGWGKSTRLLLAWDQVHVLHTSEASESLLGLIQSVEGWRNRPLHVRAEWVELKQREVDRLRSPQALRAALPGLRKQRVQAPFTLSASSGAWTALSLTQNDAVLWGYFGDDRPSPEVRFVPRGTRLSVLPRRYGDGRVDLRFRFAQDEARRLKPVKRADGVVHKPESTKTELDDVLSVRLGEPELVVAGSTSKGRVRALILTCFE